MLSWAKSQLNRSQWQIPKRAVKSLSAGLGFGGVAVRRMAQGLSVASVAHVCFAAS